MIKGTVSACCQMISIYSYRPTHLPTCLPISISISISISILSVAFTKQLCLPADLPSVHHIVSYRTMPGREFFKSPPASFFQTHIHPQRKREERVVNSMQAPISAAPHRFVSPTKTPIPIPIPIPIFFFPTDLLTSPIHTYIHTYTRGNEQKRRKRFHHAHRTIEVHFFKEYRK